MSAGRTLEEAHARAARATGRLSLMLEKRRLRRAEVELVARELREALRLVEAEVLGARTPGTTERGRRSV